MPPASVNLEAYRGDDWTQKFRFRKNDAPLDLSGSTVAAQMRSEDETELFNLVVVVTDAANGEITLELPQPPPPPGNYYYDVEVTEAGTAVSTWIKGQLYVERDVTNELPTAVVNPLAAPAA